MSSAWPDLRSSKVCFFFRPWKNPLPLNSHWCSRVTGEDNSSAEVILLYVTTTRGTGHHFRVFWLLASFLNELSRCHLRYSLVYNSGEFYQCPITFINVNMTSMYYVCKKEDRALTWYFFCLSASIFFAIYHGNDKKKQI